MHHNFFTRPDRVNEKLYVIAPVYNATRYRSRWKLYKEFENYVLSNNQAHLVTIEAAYGEREFAIEQTDSPNHTVVHLRTKSELWFKENLINLAVQRLPPDWKYMAWVDADVIFVRPDWVGETIQQLQHYKVIQMWSQYQDVTPNFELIGTARSFMDCYVYGGIADMGKNMNMDYSPAKPRIGYPGAPGLAWAMTREAWDYLGGLIDISILGACDWYMAHALVGNLELVLSKKYNPRYLELLMEWQNRAEKHIKRNVGVMKGLAIHYWHGPKVDRKYGSREQILIENNYNPDVDLKRDWQGAYQLTDRSIGLRDGLMKYGRERNEDMI